MTYSNGQPEPDDLPPHLTYQPWDHDPIVAVDGKGRVMADCACGHPMLAHYLPPKSDRRTWCITYTGDDGRCPCDEYEEETP